MAVDIASTRELLRTSILFRGLDSSTLRAVLDLSTLRRYIPGEYISRQGEQVAQVALVRMGLATLSDVSRDGDEILLGWLRPGDVCGFAGLLEDLNPFMLSVRALEATTAMCWSASALRSIAKRNPLIFKNALEAALTLGARILDRLHLISSLHVEQRISVIIVQSAKEIGRVLPDGTELRLSDEQIAQIAGTTLFSVSRLIRRWQRSGILEKSRGRILLRSGATVQRLVDVASSTSPTQRAKAALDVVQAIPISR